MKYVYTFYKGNPAMGCKLLWRDLFMGETENKNRFKTEKISFQKKIER